MKKWHHFFKALIKDTILTVIFDGRIQVHPGVSSVVHADYLLFVIFIFKVYFE